VSDTGSHKIKIVLNGDAVDERSIEVLCFANKEPSLTASCVGKKEKYKDITIFSVQDMTIKKGTTQIETTKQRLDNILSPLVTNNIVMNMVIYNLSELLVNDAEKCANNSELARQIVDTLVPLMKHIPSDSRVWYFLLYRSNNTTLIDKWFECTKDRQQLSVTAPNEILFQSIIKEAVNIPKVVSNLKVLVDHCKKMKHVTMLSFDRLEQWIETNQKLLRDTYMKELTKYVYGSVMYNMPEQTELMNGLESLIENLGGTSVIESFLNALIQHSVLLHTSIDYTISPNTKELWRVTLFTHAHLWKQLFRVLLDRFDTKVLRHYSKINSEVGNMLKALNRELYPLDSDFDLYWNTNIPSKHEQLIELVVDGMIDFSRFLSVATEEDVELFSKKANKVQLECFWRHYITKKDTTNTPNIGKIQRILAHKDCDAVFNQIEILLDLTNDTEASERPREERIQTESEPESESTRSKPRKRKRRKESHEH
jgi:hypothetical protein